MFIDFLDALRAERIPVSLKEHLMFLDALRSGVIGWDVEQFYYLARAVYVKDEAHLDRFDRVFQQVFRAIGGEGAEGADDPHHRRAIPEDWLRALAELHLTPEEMAAVRSGRSWEEIMETLRQRLDEQQGRHQGGNRMIGTAGRSPYGAQGYNPEGVRIGQQDGRHGHAIKVWDQRQFRNLDSDVELGTRSMKIALRRLRRFAREPAQPPNSTLRPRLTAPPGAA